MDAIIPAAGLATRMRGMPKFLLPCDINYQTLIERHITNLTEICNTIWIPTRPDLIPLLQFLQSQNDRIVLIPINSETMSQTVQKVLSISSSESHILVMPDTYFYGEQPYRELNIEPQIADVACWKIREDQQGKLGQVQIDKNGAITAIKDKDLNCTFEHSWGALTFSRKLEPFINSADPHIGYALKIAVENDKKVTSKIFEGRYFDCGTPKEYLQMLEFTLL